MDHVAYTALPFLLGKSYFLTLWFRKQYLASLAHQL